MEQTIDMSGFKDTVFPKKKSDTAKKNHIYVPGPANMTNAGGTAAPAKGLRDNFEMRGLLSDLLSPACGMSDEEHAKELARIRAKLESGKKLTAEEMRFLRAEDPELYQQAARVMAMREALENQLKHCTSKEQAAQIYSTTTSLVSDKDPMKGCLMAQYHDAMKEFQASDEYAALPDTEAEAAKKRKSGKPVPDIFSRQEEREAEQKIIPRPAVFSAP